MSIRNYIKKNRRQSSIAYSTICSGATSLNTPQLAAGSFIFGQGLTSNEKTDDVFPMLEGHLDKATKRASQLEEYHLKNGNAVPYGIAVNPFTEVYRLIEAIIS